ncbi:MAG: OmpH family outer membrane protein [Cytophagales bacterium]
MKYFGFIFCCFIIASSAFGQKFGYIDSEFILNKMPEYKKAEQDLNKFSQKWQTEVESKYKELDKLKQDLAAAEVLLTEDLRKERLDTIAKREKIAKDLQNKYFGFEGMIYLKRIELVKPVQEKLFLAVQKVARAKQLQIVFDKASDLTMIYTDPRHDYTDFVLEELGLGDKDDTVDNKKDK